MDRIEALKVFVLVAETASFTKAAAISGQPRSTVSSIIKELEGKYGVRLFNRTTRRVHLTHDGEALLEKSRSLIDEMEETENIFRIHQHNFSGKLVVDVPSRIGARMIAPALPEFFKSYPDIKLVLGATDRTVDLINEGVDVAIRFGTLESSSLIARNLGNFQLINCASPDYLRKHGCPSAIEDLSKHALIGYRTLDTGRENLFEYIDSKKVVKEITMKTSLVVNHAETYIASAVAGLGIIQIPAFDVQDHIAENQLQEILIDFRANSIPVSAIYPHRKHLSPRVRIFIEWFETLIKRIQQ